jgi:hypothetical protein
MRRGLALFVLLLLSASSAQASSLNRAAFLRILRRAHPAVARCAGKWHLAGRHVVRIDVVDQRVVTVVLSEAPRGEPVAARRCVASGFEKLRFPPITNIDDPGKPARLRIAYPFLIAER